jgi:hypothetical protein
MSPAPKPRPIRLASTYEVHCARCGAEIEAPSVEGVCACGTAYRFDWQAPYTAKPGPLPLSLENGT